MIFLHHMGRGMQVAALAAGVGAPTAPAQFGAGDWSVADEGTSGDITIIITALPSNGGSAITDLEYQIDGGSWVSLAGTATGAYPVSGLTDFDLISIAIRAVNAIGNGTASAAKPVMPTTWVPTALGATVICWFRGDYLTGSNGDAKAIWEDQSGNDDDAFQVVSGAEPVLAAAELNGLNVMRFQQSRPSSLAMPQIYSGKSAAMAFVVMKAPADPAASAATSGMWNFGGSTDQSHFPFTDGNVYDEFCSSVRKSAGNPTASLASWRIIGVRSASANWGMRIDGVSHFSTGTNTFQVTSSPNIGHSGTTTYFNGWMAEVIFTDSILSDANREKIEGYLAHKWGLTGNLDAGHPYKTNPPT